MNFLENRDFIIDRNGLILKSSFTIDVFIHLNFDSMKTTIFYVLMLSIIFLSTDVVSQTDTIKFDFKNKKFDHKVLEQIREGSFYQVSIDSINMNLYNVLIDKKDSSTVSTVTFPTFELIGIDNVTNLTTSLLGQTFSVSSDRKAKLILDNGSSTNQIKSLIFENDEFKHKKKNMNEMFQTQLSNKNKVNHFIDTSEYFRKQSNLDSMISENIKEIQKIDFKIKENDSIIRKLTALIKEQDTVIQLKSKIQSYSADVKSKIDGSKAVFENINHFLTKITLQSLAYIESHVGIDSTKMMSTYERYSFEEILKKSNDLRGQIQSTIKEISRIEKEFQDLKKDEKHKPYFEKNESIKKIDIELTKFISESKITLQTEVDKIKETKITEYLTSLIHLENNAKRSYVSVPLQHNGDLSSLIINITPKKPEYGQSYEFKINFPARRFYVGVGGGFYNAFSFRNDIYSTKEIQLTDTTSNFFIVDENEKKGEIGFTTLLHIGSKFNHGTSKCELINLLGGHFSIGPAISLNAKPQARLATGIGISVGKEKNMLAIDVLGMMGFVQRKSNVFDENTPYSARPENPTISKLSSSFALSIGYIYRF